MSFDLQKFETSAEHLAAAIGSGLKFFLHFASAVAPLAAGVASATGHNDVVGDINKAGAAATMVDTALTATGNFNSDEQVK